MPPLPAPSPHWQLAAQQPTCANLRIRSKDDAHKVFYAVRKGILRMVTRRLDADERAALRSGCCYAWEERSPDTEVTGLGIERFTEGRSWSPSRVRDEFLFYYEKYVNPDRARGTSVSEQPPGWQQLVKQTYSVWVDTGPRGKKKWHLTAYFTQATVDQLGTVDHIPGVGNLQVPRNIFTSTRVGKRKNTTNADTDGASQSTVTRVYAAFPSPLPALAPRPVREGYSTSTTVSRRPPSPSVQMYEPYSRAPSRTQQRSQSPVAYLNSSIPRTFSPYPYSFPSPSATQHPQSYKRQDPDSRSDHASQLHYSYNPPSRAAYSPAPEDPGPPPEPQQASGGWYTTPMLPYPLHRGSPHSEYTSSSDNSSSYAAGSGSASPFAETFPLYSPDGSFAPGDLPRVSVPSEAPPEVLLESSSSPNQRVGAIGPRRTLLLPPLDAKTRGYPYRFPSDDKALRRLRPRPAS
ncbi:Gti1/Pac2 family-domain-containing protein [Roridomyces roridus]|uniref:Gti1/Pac2 family-domain-containing protein n=1 Tax=Roridomyces roridus TaxID=1738132 RepID=A0AAD7CE83_9AGAR|nr:Gti1/Pac2 family-domain-containing protein [Roridomyces roridus]